LAECSDKFVIWVVGDDPRRGYDWKIAIETAFGDGYSVDVVSTIPVEQGGDEIAAQVQPVRRRATPERSRSVTCPLRVKS